jgi:hypothetical protein
VVFRREPEPPVDPVAQVDPRAVPRRFAGAVAEAVAARLRFRHVLEGLRPGPLRDRLDELSPKVDAGVLAVWETVQRAAEVERIAAGLDADGVLADYKRARRDTSTPPELMAALEERFESVQRLLNVVDDVDQRLQLLDARLGAAVARAAELAVVAADDPAVSLGEELDAVVSELGHLRDTMAAL